MSFPDTNLERKVDQKGGLWCSPGKHRWRGGRSARGWAQDAVFDTVPFQCGVGKTGKGSGWRIRPSLLPAQDAPRLRFLCSPGVGGLLLCLRAHSGPSWGRATPLAFKPPMEMELVPLGLSFFLKQG